MPSHFDLDPRNATRAGSSAHGWRAPSVTPHTMRSCSLPTLLAFATIGIGCVPNLDYLENGPRDGGLGGLTGANDSSASGGGAGGRAGSSGGEQDASDAGRGGADAKGDEGDSGLDSSNSGIGGGGSQAGGGGSDGGGRGGGAGAGGGPADAGGDRVGDATNDVGPEVLGPVEPYLTLIPVCNEDGGCESARADSYVNAAPWRHNGLLTVGNYQFIAYYGQYTTSGTYGAIIGRRHINSRTWTLTRTAFLPAGNDWSRAYSSVQFGVDGDGVLHMGWGGTGLTSTRAYYTQSTASVLNDSPMTIIGGDIGNTGSMSEATAGEQFPMESDSSVQYMEFYAIPGSGDLLMPFRTGSTGNGDYQLARWDNSGKVWQAVHASASAPWISGHSATYGSPYINQLAFDSQGVLHASWTFRNSGISANNDFFYARSLDKGLTWVPGDGTTAYPTPMTGSNPPYAVFIEPPPSFNLVNQCGMATDRQDHPVVACWYTPSGSAYRQIMVMWYDGSQWHPSQVSSRTVVDQNPNEPARPLILIDEADRWLVVWRDGRAATNGIKLAYSRSVARDDWRTLDLTTDSLGTWEPVYDVQRWNTDGVLSLYYQRCGLELLSPVSVLEFRAREYFRAAAQGDAGVGADASVDAGKAGGDGGN